MRCLSDGTAMSMSLQVLFSWSLIVSSYLLHVLHIGSEPSFTIIACYDLLAKLWSCAVIIKPSALAVRPVLLSHWWVLF